MAYLVFNRRELMKSVLGGLWVCGLGRGRAAQRLGIRNANESGLAAGFPVPLHSAKPWVYWMWMNGNITQEGITADLEAMKAVGIGGALIMNLGFDQPGPVRFMTPEWQGMFHHAVTEARRLGLTIDMNNDDGWNCGGPSITPQNAMQKIVWTETHIQGPREVSALLPQPPATWNLYHDIRVLAFPRPAGDENDSADLTPRISTGVANPPYLQLDFAEAFAARAIVLSAAGKQDRPATCELQISDNGKGFRTVRRFETGWRYPTSAYSSITVGFREARVRFYRLLMPGANLGNSSSQRFSARLLGGSRISFWEFKGGFSDIREYGSGIPFFAARKQNVSAALPEKAFIPRQEVIDLSERMDATGRLHWTAPPGAWTILHIGYTPTGQLNRASTIEGRGPDCNKLSPTGVQAQFRALLGKLIMEVKPDGAKALTFAHNDSWESECQNWTEEFRKEFQKRRGYEILPYLPVLAGGRIVDNTEVSERFLWDMRRTLADLIAEYYWQALWKDCNARGLKFSQEAGGRGQFMYDPINYLSKGDIPMGEVWMGEALPRPDCKLAASTAHIYGRQLVGSETFTCMTQTWPSSGEWKSHPFSLKAKGDKAFCAGINHLTFHRYLLQPWLDRKPGLAWANGSVKVGTSFERTQTWWKPGAAWIQYLSRCQSLLQQGQFVADVCVFTGESVPNVLFRPVKNPSALSEREDASTSTEKALTRSGLSPTLPPSGYDFDGCNLEVLSQMSVVDGRLTLPHGMSYRLLTLPPVRQMTPRVLHLIKKLVEAGGIVVGPKPARSPSLSGYPACDEEVRQLAAQVWGACDGKTIKEQSFGKGKVIWGKPMSEILSSIGVTPDFEYTSLRSDTRLDFIHRRDGEAEIYFVSNQQARFEEAECTFRVSGKVPELWRPDTGYVSTCRVYEHRDGRTVVPLRFDPCGSVFVVFRKAATGKPIVTISREGKEFPRFANGLGERFRGIEVEATKEDEILVTTAVSGKYQFRASGGSIVAVDIPPVPGPEQIEGPWEVHFPPHWGAPERITFNKLISWTEHPNDGVKYFSGTATYVKEFEVPAEAVSPTRVLYLDLGRVKELASVKLNGRELGVLWKPPFRAEISSAVKPGKNRLEVKVTNLWPNRLIGDLRLPEEKRYTRTNRNPFTRNSPLLESGLIGPVVMRVAAKMKHRL